MMNLWRRKRYHPWQDYFWARQDLFNARLLWKDSFNLIEYRITPKVPEKKKEWEPIQESLLPDISCTLTEKEINLLLGKLSTPDGLNPMFFKEGNFVNRELTIIYPVRGKRIYVEVVKPG